MSSTLVEEHDPVRADRELVLIGVAAGALVIGLVFLGLVVDAYRVSGQTGGVPGFTTVGVVFLGGSLVYARFYLRSNGERRALKLDPDTRSYEVVRGWWSPRVVDSGGYGDFAAVRLETRERLIHFRNSPPRPRLFWAVMLDWKDKDRRPLCLKEFKGPFGKASLPLPPGYGFERLRALELLHRWAVDLDVSAVGSPEDRP